MPKKTKGKVIWFTGLSGAGKSTICEGVAARLRATDVPVEVLDGDVLRKSLCKDLTFTEADRMENISRIGFVANLLASHGVTALVAAISPTYSIREIAMDRCKPYIEVFVDAPLAVCESRDVKGLYKKARRGEVQNFTGIDSPYERPLSPNLTCLTAEEDIASSVERVLHLIRSIDTVNSRESTLHDGYYPPRS